MTERESEGRAAPSWLGILGSLPPSVGAGISTRQGGVSTGSLATLNLGSRCGDDAENITENLARLERSCGVELQRAARIRLVHGVTVREAQHFGFLGEADALVTLAAGLPLALTVADCFPVYLWGSRQGVGLVHCGWRGVLGGIVSRATRALAILSGDSPDEIGAWIGPGIGPCCFEVSAELAERFPPEVRSRPPTPSTGMRVDLPALLTTQLIAAGLVPSNIEHSGLCTSCREDLFYSHRRDRGCTGRMLAWIVRHDPQ
jgi:YfiH family protein